jgi:hypothetical protein
VFRPNRRSSLLGDRRFSSCLDVVNGRPGRDGPGTLVPDLPYAPSDLLSRDGKEGKIAGSSREDAGREVRERRWRREKRRGDAVVYRGFRSEFEDQAINLHALYGRVRCGLEPNTFYL